MAPDPEKTPAEPEDQWGPWRRRIAASQRMREDRVSIWQKNVEKRKAGKGNESTENGVSINKDWPLTKSKEAQLYSQNPEVRLTPKEDLFAPIVPLFSKTLNDTIGEANVGAAIEEELADVINASGIAGCLTSCEVSTEPKLVSTVSPIAAGMSGQPAQMMTVNAPVDIRHLTERISPADLLIPTDFTGSDYDMAPWLGREGRRIWSVAQKEFGLTEEQKELVISGDRRASRTTSSLNTDTNKFRDNDVVNFTELFIWDKVYNPAETRFKALRRMVFVDGLDEPVIDEPYAGQKRMPDGTIVGVLRNPIQILTLTYISDEALPPSDSTISRTQVDELEDIHDLMIQQRKHSIPWRWADGNRISPNQKAQLEKGTVQGVIITNGPGDRAVGEVARASFPPEDFEFERQADHALSNIYQVGVNQEGNFAKGERSAREASIIDQNFQRRVGKERDKVTKHFVRIAEVHAGHLALYGNLPLPAGIPKESIANGFVYSVRADASVRLDADEQIRRLEHQIDRLAQSPYADVRPLVAKWLELGGQDPSKIIIEPQPKPPEPVSLSLKGEDLINPIALAHLFRTGQGASPEDMAAAEKLLGSIASGVIQQLAAMQQKPDDGRPPRESDTPGMANADWQMAPRQDKRDVD